MIAHAQRFSLILIASHLVADTVAMKKPRRYCLMTLYVVSECSLPEFIVALPLLFKNLGANPFRDSHRASSLFPLATASLSSNPAVVNHEGLKFYEDPIEWLASRSGKGIPTMTSQKSCKSKPWAPFAQHSMFDFDGY